MAQTRRWIISAIRTSKAADVTMPWQRSVKVRPAAVRHIQMQVAPRPKAAAAR